MEVVYADRDEKIFNNRGEEIDYIPRVMWNARKVETLREPNGGLTEVLGGGETFTALGVDWTLKPLTFAIRAQFEQVVRRNAVAAIEGLGKDGATPEMIHQAMSQFISDRASGKYNWGGSILMNSLNEPNSVKWLTQLLLEPRPTDEQLNDIFIEVPYTLGTLIGFVLGNSVAPQKTGLPKAELEKARARDLALKSGRRDLT